MSEGHAEAEAATRLFVVKTSSLLKAPLLRPSKKLSKSGLTTGTEMHLSAEDLRCSTQRGLLLASRRAAGAEARQWQRLEEETRVMLCATLQGHTWATLPPDFALDLALATRDTLQAEAETARLRIIECEKRLETLRNAGDDAAARWLDADDQLACLLVKFETEGVEVNPHARNYRACDRSADHCLFSDSDDYDSLLGSTNGDYDSTAPTESESEIATPT